MKFIQIRVSLVCCLAVLCVLLCIVAPQSATCRTFDSCMKGLYELPRDLTRDSEYALRKRGFKAFQLMQVAVFD